jgi:hypothetical protein
MKKCTTIPPPELRDEILRCYVEFVHPYMPIIDLRDLDLKNGHDSISLLLFQAIMFAGVTFAPLEMLQRAGYPNKKDARRIFFNRTRLLYDFDVEQDRISLVQALLLMSYWYETPDDQKDTWHWMGIAVSLSNTIGLHRNPEGSNLDAPRQKLWKRIWWSLMMRDRLVALGMRRPTRIDLDACNVPMLTLDDFELIASPWSPDVELQRKLAVLCIEKAKLCICISHVLSTQYTVLNSVQGRITSDGNAATTMMLLPKKAPEAWQIKACNDELSAWFEALPGEAKYSSGTDSFVLHQALLQMFYYTIMGALHRPQLLPNMTLPLATEPQPSAMSRQRVRAAAAEISKITRELHSRNLAQFLPTEGVTVLLPTLIIHLLDVKSNDPVLQKTAMKSFTESMQVLQNLREMYNAADYAAMFLEAAVGKVSIKPEGIQTTFATPQTPLKSNNRSATSPLKQKQQRQQHHHLANQPELSFSPSSTTSDMDLVQRALQDPTLTPPPEETEGLRNLSLSLGLDMGLRLPTKSFSGLSGMNLPSSSAAPSSMCPDIFTDVPSDVFLGNGTGDFSLGGIGLGIDGLDDPFIFDGAVGNSGLDMDW